MSLRFLNAWGRMTMFFIVAGLLTGCHNGAGANSPTPARQSARAAILLIARGVSVADEMCATVAEQRGDLPLARTCRKAYDVARPALLAAEAGVDSWDAGQRGRAACASADAAVALAQVATALTKAGVSVPPLVVDALSLAQPLAEVCHAE